MKKLFLCIPLIALSLFCIAQDSIENQNRFLLGLGLSMDKEVTYPSQQTSPIGIGINIQAENRFSSHFSGFAAGEVILFTGYSLPLIIQAGPRIYLKNQFFFGIGLGLALVQYYKTSFNYFPHIGFNWPWSAVMLGYNAINLAGYSHPNYYVFGSSSKTIGLLKNCFQI